MSPHSKTLRLSPLALAVAAALGATSLPVLATPQSFGNITLDASYALGTNSSAAAVDGLTDPAGQIFSSASGADFFLSKSDALNNNIFFHTYGFEANPTYFGARASGEGSFFGKTRSSYSATVSNSSGVAQSVAFTFNVAGGNLGITGTGEGLAELLLAVKRDGVVMALDHTTIMQDIANVVTCTNENLGSLGANAECASGTDSSVNAAGGLFTVGLGLLDAGASFTLDYDIIATVSGNLSNGTRLECNYGGGYGDGAAAFAEIVVPPPNGCVEVPVPGGAIARSGDPFDSPIFDVNGNLISTPPPTFDPQILLAPAQIPEPGTLLLAGAGLMGLARSTRRRRRDLS